MDLATQSRGRGCEVHNIISKQAHSSAFERTVVFYAYDLSHSITASETLARRSRMPQETAEGAFYSTSSPHHPTAFQTQRQISKAPPPPPPPSTHSLAAFRPFEFSVPPDAALLRVMTGESQ